MGNSLNTWVASTGSFLIHMTLVSSIGFCQVLAQNSDGQTWQTGKGGGYYNDKTTPIQNGYQKTRVLDTVRYGNNVQQKDTRSPGSVLARTIREHSFSHVRDKLVGMKRDEITQIFGKPDSVKTNASGNETFGFVLSSLGTRTANTGTGLNVFRAHWLELDITGGKVDQARDFNSVTSQHK
jgi:hypothetical protein